MPANHDVQAKRLIAIRPDGSELYGAWVRRDEDWEYETWVEGLDDEDEPEPMEPAP